jgi:nitronate monooxygenase
MAWVLDRDRSQLDAVLELNPLPALVSVSFGTYRPYVEELQANGIVVATQVGNGDDVRAAAGAGVDVIVARGAEAGGHGRNDIGTLPLLELVLEETDQPVLAAGGISSARGVAAVLAAGAVGAWIGTAFLACPEADNSAAARARVLASDGDTAYGRVFDVGLRQHWPAEFGGRALRNEFFDRWEGREGALAADDEAADRLRRAMADGDFDTGVIYAGQGVVQLREERSAAEVVASLSLASALLRQAADDVTES